MRKHMIWILAVALALTAVGAASGENIQSITGSVSPKKLPKKGAPKAVKLSVDVSTTNPANPFSVPSPTTVAKVDFDKDLKIQNKGLPTCDTSSFGAATTIQDVKDECGPAIIGSGSATVQVPLGAGQPPTIVPAEVIAANVKGKQILLHTQNSLSGGQPLIGKIGKGPGGKYGTTLTVNVPPLAGGSAVLTQFKAAIKKTYSLHGKKLSYVSANCKDKKIHFQARFTYQDGTSDTATSTQKCKQKG
jgi:hypothetical protein